MALGSNATLKCLARGYPVPKIIWTVDEIHRKLNDTFLPEKEFLFENDGAVLHLVNLQHRGLRNFHCIAINDAGSETLTFTIKTISNCNLIV